MDIRCDSNHFCLLSWTYAAPDVVLNVWDSLTGYANRDRQRKIDAARALIQSKWPEVREVLVRECASLQQPSGSNDCGLYVIRNAARLLGDETEEWTADSYDDDAVLSVALRSFLKGNTQWRILN